jgi:hypothetical protein
MKLNTKFFNNESGGMMMEILLSLTIAAVALPFVMRDMDGRTRRAENVVIARDISMTRDALEKYMDVHKRELFAPTGRNITRVKVSDLAEYGNIPNNTEKFQARIIKSRDRGGRSVLAGMVIYDSADISPMRTHEIAELGGQSAGFAERGQAYGAFGTWQSKTNIFDANFGAESILTGTNTILSGGDFLWRLPSGEALNATMASDLSLGEYDISDAGSIDAYDAQWSEIVKANLINARKVQITPRTNLESEFIVSGETLVMGALTSDSRNAQISGELFLNGDARLSRLDAGELWVGDLNLNGFSIGGSEEPATLKIGQTLDITRGRVSARIATIGYTGSVAPKIVVAERIEDSSDTSYYWDFASGDARLFDVSAGQLGQMVRDALRAGAVKQKTTTETIIGQVSANRNATIADYVRAINEIRTQVEQKYIQLNLRESGIQ